jgi:hypothetical protein
MKLADCVFILLCLTAPVSLLAQSATLRGVVTDESGAVVPSATVTLAGPRGDTAAGTSNDRGAFTFANIAPGSYTIRVSAPQLTLGPIPINLAPGMNTRDLQLSVAAVVESINVDQDAAPIATEASANASATTLRGQDLDALSADPEDLMADLQALAGPSAGPTSGSIYVDGFSGGDLPPKEAIREVRVNQNPFSPEFDRLGLGRIEIVTKPGADHWRGNLNYNYATDAWNSRNPYSAVKAPLLLNEFENTIGGPLGKRASMTLNANQYDVDNGSIVNAVTLNSQTLAASPFFDIFKTIQRRTSLYSRVDDQLNDNHTLSLRYSFAKGDIQGAGIGGFDVVSRGYHATYNVQIAQAIETAALSPGAVNETRFQYYRNDFRTLPNSSSPEVQVLGSFNGGGSTAGNARDLRQSFEFHNITILGRRSHTWRFGVRARLQTDDNVSPGNFNGTFTFSGGLAPALNAQNQPLLDGSGQTVFTQIDSIERYRRTLLFQALGDSPAQIQALGGGASQFTIASGAPGISGRQSDVGAFFGDDWRLRPNLTLNVGVRYEAQTNIRDLRDWAPRVGIAWAPRGSGNKPSKTVLRAGFGIFYDRFPLGGTLAAKRYNGIVQQQYVVNDPGFFPSIPSLASLAASGSPVVVEKVDSGIRAPYLLQSAFTVERQFVRTTVAVTYTSSRGLHSLRSLDLNAPLPGSGLFPLGNPNPLFLMTSSGVYNQNQISANFNSKVNKSISLTGSYTFNRARSNTDGLGTFPANPYDYTGEYGPASNDVRHRVNLAGTINTKWRVRFSPFVSIQTGAPFNITTGSDPYNTTLFNARPGIDAPSGKAGLIQTSYGLLDPNPTPGETLLTRNDGRGPGQISLNLRVGKTIVFGPEQGKAGVRRYSATISLSVRNLTNHTNPGPIVGAISSPLFGRANQMAGPTNGEGFSENANNRRLELQIRFSF